LLWDMATHRPIGSLFTTSPVDSLAFSPDGKILATGNDNGAIQLWDAATQQPITVFTATPGPITSVAFSPDGKTLASATADHTVALWDVAYLADVVKQLCASAERPLTRAEWAHYAPGPAYERIC